MKIVVDTRAEQTAGPELTRKFEEALQLLAGEEDAARRTGLQTLAAILRAHTPLSTLGAYPAEQLAGLVRSFYAFLEHRPGDTAVQLLRPADGGPVLLLTSTPDAPYLVDSILNLLARRELSARVISHPIISARRRKGTLSHLGTLDEGAARESFIVVEIESLPMPREDGLCHAVERVLTDVLLVQRDKKELQQRLRDVEELPGLEDYRDFCRWLQDANFHPFSYRQLRVGHAGKGKTTVQQVDGSALGIEPDPQELTCCRQRSLDEFPEEFQRRILRDGAVVVEELERRSPVHRAERLVYFGIREPLSEGVWQEHVFLGLFSHRSLDELNCNIPALRRKIEDALAAAGIPAGCHDYRKMVEIFNTFPKVELFFMTPAEVLETVRSFTLLYRQGAIKVVATRSLAVGGATLLVIMPRDFYSEENLARIETYLRRSVRGGTVSSRVIHISSDYLSLHVAVAPRVEELRIDLDRLERGLTNITLPWGEKLRQLLERRCGDDEGRRRWQRYASVFSREYQALIHPRFAVRDITRIERLLDGNGEQFDMWGPFRLDEPYCRLQFYSLRESPLNELMPFLENLNLSVIDEVDFTLSVAGRKVFIKSFALRSAVADDTALATLRVPLLEALGALRSGALENDYLNMLLVPTGLSWRQIDVFRGYRNYYFQLGSPFSKKRVAFALINNPKIALLLYRYFEARFKPEPRWSDPLVREEEVLSPLRMELAEALQDVPDVNEDQILRILFNLIDSTVRTNFFLREQRPDYFFSFKISAIGIIDMPAPRPLFEIYVHAATMEGIHLRGGKVARGGIRWSDRPDDFRTEILGLMKTQMTKNVVIVPVGSKGGFVVKTPFQSREEGATLSKAAYQTLMRGLLDLTDNRVDGKVVHPEGVVAYDAEDPYLVVAADKGTAHLSDTANAISREYGFWLGDAYASGGSHGYDHKELAITARGAWECVKGHFRELGRDIQSEPFTVVGVGDMSGDVFGNGMLLSRKIRLLAAFDHRHIFLDPDPDPAVTFKERQRLFKLPRSSWDDYDRALISKGGGIYPRDAKEIPLSAEVRRWLGVRHESMDPPGLIRLLLTAEVDLLWNGGIGTYVKASSEKNEDVGDRANDAVRVDGGRLRAKVVGEGGNLGFTQKGRIEYALAGGRINTDAVDNSGGVDCSDHEVNLKIFMQHLQQLGLIADFEARNKVLEEITDAVCDKVLANNISQSRCLSLDVERCGRDVEPFLELADRLEGAALLDRHGEFLPTTKEVLARPGTALSRPELSILMAYSKMQLYQNLLESDLPLRPGAADFLIRYFPVPIRERFGAQLAEHPLAREITATVMTNAVINQAGSAFVHTLVRRTGATPVAVVAAYLAFDRVLDGASLRALVCGVDSPLTAQRQQQLMLRLENALATLCYWALRYELGITPEPAVVEHYREGVRTYAKTLGGILPAAEWEQCKADAATLEDEGLDAETAGHFAVLERLGDFLSLETLVEATGSDLYSVARTYNDVRRLLGIGELLELAGRVVIRDRWDRLAYQSLNEAFATLGFNLTREIFRRADGNPEAYFAGRRQKLTFYRNLRTGLGGAAPANYHPFAVLQRALEGLLAS